MKLPNHTQVDPLALTRIAEALQCPGAEITAMPETGITNAAFAIGSRYILRIPRDHPMHHKTARTESIVVPIAVDAHVRTPDLRMYDETRTLISAPFTVYDRVSGLPLELVVLDPSASQDVWQEVGSDLSRLHLVGSADARANQLDLAEPIPHPEDILRQRLQEGWFTELEFHWLREWLYRLEAYEPVTHEVLSHGDVQSANIIVDPRAGRYLALIDWGDACWRHPAWDFAAVPLRVVPDMLNGYVAAGGVTGLEPAIIARRTMLWLLMLPRGPVPGRSWAERPLGMLLDMLGFFANTPTWAKWSPQGS